MSARTSFSTNSTGWNAWLGFWPLANQHGLHRCLAEEMCNRQPPASPICHGAPDPRLEHLATNLTSGKMPHSFSQKHCAWQFSLQLDGFRLVAGARHSSKQWWALTLKNRGNVKMRQLGLSINQRLQIFGGFPKWRYPTIMSCNTKSWSNDGSHSSRLLRVRHRGRLARFGRGSWHAVARCQPR